MLQDDLDKFEREVLRLRCLKEAWVYDEHGKLVRIKLPHLSCPDCQALETIAKLRASQKSVSQNSLGHAVS